MRLYRKLWLLDVAMMAVCVSSMYCAGAEPFDDFQSEVDGDRPIRIVESEKVRAWASGIGKPAGARQRMLDVALPVVSHMWNVHPAGAEQLLPFDLDDAPEGPCVKQRLSLWSIPGKPQIFACPAWIECSIEGDRSLYGQAGCNLALAHELGHVLGASTSVSGRRSTTRSKWRLWRRCWPWRPSLCPGAFNLSAPSPTTSLCGRFSALSSNNRGSAEATQDFSSSCIHPFLGACQ